MARIKYYDNGTSTWKYADMAVQLPARLPSAYKEVEYIESDGTGQYFSISASHQYSKLSKAIVDFQFNSINTGNILFGGVGSSHTSFFFGANGTAWRYGVSTDYTYGTFDTDRHTFLLSNGSQKLDSTEISTYTWASTATDVLTLSRNANGAAFANCKIYSFGFYENDAAVCVLVPCYRVADSEVGMYDLVTGTFYTNAGTGTFTKGADV